MVAPSVSSSVRRRGSRLVRTVLTGVGLLLAATHCVEIDDRDLDVHGADDGGGTGGTGANRLCQIDSDDDACGVCVKQECCDTFAACINSVDCQYFSACLSDCGTLDEACIDPCATQYPEGGLIFVDYLSCSNDYCSTECSGG